MHANGSGVCRANSGDLRKQSRKAGAGIARWSFGITPCYAQSIIFKNSKLFEIRKERPTGYTRAVDAQAQDRECKARRDCLDCASTYLYIRKNRSIYSNTSSIVSKHWFYSSFFRTINVKKKRYFLIIFFIIIGIVNPFHKHLTVIYFFSKRIMQKSL